MKIGMYFGYLGHYTQWLVFPAFLGLVLWLLEGTSQVGSALPLFLLLLRTVLVHCQPQKKKRIGSPRKVAVVVILLSLLNT